MVLEVVYPEQQTLSVPLHAATEKSFEGVQMKTEVNRNQNQAVKLY